MRKVIAGMLVVMLLLFLMPVSVVYAAQDESLGGKFTAASTGPELTAVGLYQTDHSTTVSAMTPQVEYAVKVDINHKNKLKHLDTVKVTIFYDDDGDDDPADVPTSGDTQTVAILTCTVGTTPSWGIDPASSTTWTIESANCVQPDLNGTTGTFWFHFKPGKVATEAGDWDIYGYAEDGSSKTDTLYDASNYDMNWYGGIDVTTTEVDWGSVELGSDFSSNVQTGVEVKYTANGNYKEEVKASSPWTGSMSITLSETGNPGDDEFALKADDSSTLGNAIVVKSSAYTAIDETGTQTSEAGNTVGTNTLWLELGGQGIEVADYTGTIYFQVADR